MDNVSYSGNVGLSQLTQFSRQCWTRSVISFLQVKLDKVSYLSLAGKVGLD